jgi:hypothetical protein
MYRGESCAAKRTQIGEIYCTVHQFELNILTRQIKMNISILILIFSFLACSIQVQSKLYAKDDDSDEEVEVPKENLEPRVALKDMMAVIKSTYGQNIGGMHFCKYYFMLMMT